MRPERLCYWLPMSILSPTPEAIISAARVIRDGGVVVMPTETVYGLACNALDEKAVQRVFDIKGRPSENPLIVHIADFSELKRVAESWPPVAELLAKKFWPGALTMVLPKKSSVPTATTAGLETVAVRMPSHHVAVQLIRESACPIAAPSANVFMGLSPTRAQDIDPEIDVEVPIILDGGPCEVGLESTVVDLTGDSPVILRPGGVTRAEIQAAIGRPLGHIPPSHLRKSPGMYRRHYSPKAVLILQESVQSYQPGLVFSSPQNTSQIKMPRDPKAYAFKLYSALRQLDNQGETEIYVEEPPDKPEWEAVLDRLRKASSKLI